MENLKKGYADTLEHAEFLTSQTQVHAVDKAKSIHTFIAADPWVMDDKKISEYYRNVRQILYNLNELLVDCSSCEILLNMCLDECF